MRKPNARTVAIVGAAVGAAAAVTAGIAAVVRRVDPHLVPRTMFGPALVLTLSDAEGAPLRLLGVGRSVQSGTYLGDRRYDLPFEYYRGFARVLGAAGVDEGRVLVLGGGGYAIPKHVVSHEPGLAVDVVEIDPVITDIARRWFYLGDLEREYRTRVTGRLRVTHADALAFLQSCPDRYEAVIVDVFAGSDPAPTGVVAAMARGAREHLSEGGVCLQNVVCPADDARPALEMARVLAGEFGHVGVLPCTDEMLSDDDNFIVFASDRMLDVPGAFGLPED